MTAQAYKIVCVRTEIFTLSNKTSRKLNKKKGADTLFFILRLLSQFRTAFFHFYFIMISILLFWILLAFVLFEAIGLIEP